MLIDAYDGISQKEINTQRKTSEGKAYTLNHPNDLLVPMRYQGENEQTSNSQGWERNGSYYFRELKNSHPEYFSKQNSTRIESGTSPKVDSQFVENFPQYKGYENEVLIHHHIGKDGQAVALPASVHKGSGEIHNVENELGVTNNAQRFSDRCKEASKKDQSLFGKTSAEIKETVIKEHQKGFQQINQNAPIKNSDTRSNMFNKIIEQNKMNEIENNSTTNQQKYKNLDRNR